MNFFYTFIETLLHSIWQAAMLLFVYIFINNITTKYSPIQKRDFLYFLLFSQFFISISTFIGFFYNYGFAISFRISQAFIDNYLPFFNNYYAQVFTVYLFIVLIKILHTIFQWSTFKNEYNKHIIKPAVSLKIFTTLQAHHLCINKKVTLWFSNTINIPVTFGYFKPVILLPISLINGLTIEQTELIILHELMHIKSKDYLLNWFLLFMETIYFFNPFIKIIAEKLKLEREKNCDIQVLNYENDSIKYAETLYKIAESNTVLKTFQLGIFKNNSQLFKRISFFASDKNSLPTKINSFFAIGFLYIITGMISFLMITNNYVGNSANTISVKSFQEFFQKNITFLPPVQQKKIQTSLNNKKANPSKDKKNEVEIFKNRSITNSDIEEPENYITAVSFSENIDSTKELIYNLETKSGTITQSYKLIKRNGTWMIEPRWMIKVSNDTSLIKKNIDSSFVIKLLEVQ